MWDIRVERRFLKDVRRIPPHVKKRIDALIIHGIEDPFSIPGLKRMSGAHGYWRIRIGSYRVGVLLDEESQTISFIAVGARGDFYNDYPPR